MGLHLCKRLIGYNEEIVDMKFLGDDENFLAVATNLEQVNILFSFCCCCCHIIVAEEIPSIA